MFARKGVFSSIGRAGAVATVVAVALTAVQPSMAFAGSRAGQGRDGHGRDQRRDRFQRPRQVLSRRRRAAAAAAFAGIVGTGLAIAAAQNRRDYYDSYGYYDAAPAYYGGGPVYYGDGLWRWPVLLWRLQQLWRPQLSASGGNSARFW